MKAWVNGKLCNYEDITVHLLSHSFSRASAIFEVMEIVHTDEGPCFFCLDEHIRRFFSSAQATFMELPITPKELIDALSQTARANRIESGVAKFFAYYPDLGLGTLPASSRIDVAVFCFGYGQMGIEHTHGEISVSAGISSFRKIDPHATAVHAKVVGNYVNGYLAKREVQQKGFDEAIMLDTHGYIAEAPTANIFLIKDTVIETPPAENVLPGITRALLIQVLAKMGLSVRESLIRPEDLVQYQEAFFSGTLSHVQPIHLLEGRALECPGPVTRAIHTHMELLTSGRLHGYDQYLHPIDSPGTVSGKTI